MTGNRTIIVPDTVQQYWVANNTTGAYTLSVGTALGASVAINQGARGIFYSDGVDVVNADTASISFPINVSQGGTGATTAAGARINLGATSVGDSVFTATNQLTALTALGGGTEGILMFVSSTNADLWNVLGVAPAGVVDGGSF